MDRKTRKNINVVSHILEIVFKIGDIACWIGVGFMVASIAYVIIKGNLNDIVLNSRVTIKSPIKSDWLETLSIPNAIAVCSITAVKSGIYAFIFSMASKMFKNVRNSPTPFVMDNVIKMRVISILYLVSSGCAFTGDNFGYTLEFSFGGIIGALLIFGISFIFEYGCQLQKESDETL